MYLQLGRHSEVTSVSGLAHFIAARMESMGIDATEVVVRSGIPKQTISNLVLGRNKDAPELRTLAALARALDIDLADLIEAAGYKVGEPADDDESRRLARLLRQIPWLVSGVHQMLALPADELRTLLRYMELRVDQHQADRDSRQTNGE